MLKNQGHEVSRGNERGAGMTVCSHSVQPPKKQKRHGSGDLGDLFYIWSSSSFACAVKGTNLG